MSSSRPSPPKSSSSLFLPKRGMRSHTASAAPAPPTIAPTPAPAPVLAPAPPSSSADFGASEPGPSSSKIVEGMLDPGRRKKRKLRGREMMVKVFYSLSSPRFGQPPHPTPSAAPSPLPPLDPALLALLDPALAPTPNSYGAPSPSPAPEPLAPQQPQNQSYSCLARLSSPVFVELLGPQPQPGASSQEYGKITLKTCLSAICISRPELVDDPTKDYAVSAFDPWESSTRPQPSGQTPGASGYGGASAGELMEGKGMLSWNLAEKHKGTTWVSGRVTGNPPRGSKRRKTDSAFLASEEDMDDDDDSDDDAGDEALEVQLQLVERPAFTQTQFLTSLRSFAHPAPGLASSPVKRPPIAATVSAPPAPAGPPGDPVKKKRNRDSLLFEERMTRPSLTASAKAQPPQGEVQGASEAEQLAALQNPQVLALLGQFLPGLTGNAPATTEAQAPADLANVLGSEQGKILMPALRTLAKFYGLQVPGANESNATESSEQSGRSSSFDKATASSSLPASTLPAQLPSSSGAGPSGTAKSRRAKALKFTPIPGNSSRKSTFCPVDPAGCPHCRRKKSTVWLEMYTPQGQRQILCNACAVHFNKTGSLRQKVSTSPVRPAAQSSPRRASGKGRPLQPRLTAACAEDLKKIKKQRAGPPGLVAPPSPSKHVGPSLRSPSNIFRSVSGGSAAHALRSIMTSPGARSPRRGAHATFATSPVQRSRRVSGKSARGGDDGYDSDGGARMGSTPAGFDFAAMFGTNQSPSPAKRSKDGVPSYLLTASPGTALNRILNDTSCDINSFGIDADDEQPQITRSASRRAAQASMGSGHPPALSSLSASTSNASGNVTPFAEHDLSFYLRSSPLDMGDRLAKEREQNETEKENARPGPRQRKSSAGDPTSSSAAGNSTITGNPLLGNVMPSTTTDGASTDGPSEFDSLISSLRRDFDSKFSSNAMTAPSSPPGSSPCVQPRTSQATPGTKGKAPQSCGRPAPSILTSFIDSLEPAVARSVEPGSEDEWTAEAGKRERSKTMTYEDSTGAVHQTDPLSGFDPLETATATRANGDLFSANQPKGAASARGHLFPSRAFTTHSAPLSDAGPTSDFDYGSLPPSSPPALPSEAFPTPSDFDAGVTPDEEGYQTEAEDNTGAQWSALTAPAELMTQSSMVALLKAYTDGSGATGELGQMLSNSLGGGKIELDRETVNQLLHLLQAQNNGRGVAPSLVEPKATLGVSPAASTPFAPTPAGEVSGAEGDEEGDALFERMFGGPGY